MPSVFADQSDDLFARYHVELQFRDKVMAGVPKDPKLIEGWLRGKAGIEDEIEIRQALARTLLELGIEIPDDADFDDITKATEKLANIKQTCGFKRDENGLYIEGRQIKAAIKESVNILFAHERWGRTRKGPKAYAAEHIFVEPNTAISLGRDEPDGVDLVIGHVTGPQGKRSTLGYHEFVRRPRISFDLLVTEDGIQPEHWVKLWLQAERIGLGALRSQSHGTFEVEAWEHTSGPQSHKPITKADREADAAERAKTDTREPVAV